MPGRRALEPGGGCQGPGARETTDRPTSGVGVQRVQAVAMGVPWACSARPSAHLHGAAPSAALARRSRCRACSLLPDYPFAIMRRCAAETGSSLQCSSAGRVKWRRRAPAFLRCSAREKSAVHSNDEQASSGPRNGPRNGERAHCFSKNNCLAVHIIGMQRIGRQPRGKASGGAGLRGAQARPWPRPWP